VGAQETVVSFIFAELALALMLRQSHLTKAQPAGQ